jgi:glycosyltransferase involved in cell wall biosynthesis
MQRESGRHTPVVAAQLVNCLGLGGTERQLVEHVRWMDRSRYAPDVSCLQKKGELLGELRELGIDPPEFHLRGGLVQPNTGLQIVRLARRLRERGAALLHCHDFYSNLVGLPAARLAGIPVIVSRRDLGVWISPRQARLLHLVTSRADRVLCNAYAVRDQLLDREGVDPARIAVVPNGLDLNRFDAEAAGPVQPEIAALDGSHPTVVLVGNMKHAVKGHADLLAAAALVLREHPDVRFVLVGDGALRAGLEADARAAGIAHAIVFVGRRTDVPALLARATVGVSASHTEGLSNAVMEAMAARLPVVATAVGGTVELVRDGRSGFLVPREDAPALAQRIGQLVRRPELAQRMGRRGRQRIEEEYSTLRLGERMAALYDALLGGTEVLPRAA